MILKLTFWRFTVGLSSIEQEELSSLVVQTRASQHIRYREVGRTGSVEKLMKEGYRRK